MAVELSSLPWDALRQALSDGSLLTMASRDAWRAECVPIFEDEGFPFGPASTTEGGGSFLVNGSNYQLLDQPSGLCADVLSCAWKRCDWAPMPLLDILGGDFNDADEEAIAVNLADYFDPDSVPDELWELPHAVVHPETAGDIVTSIEFGREHGVGMSVKTSGHHYTGASTDGDSILLNMRRYPKYASEFTDESLLQCEGEGEGEGTGAPTDIQDSPKTTQEIRSLACDVALSRNVGSAILRVGGGEIWDEVYRAVSGWNEAKAGNDGEYLYHVVGGGAGTVSATGGYMGATGLSGTQGMRMFGFACDQVVQMEMVLPTGQLVRFGPTEWTDPGPEDDADWPQTTKVTGWCNDDPTLPEEQWSWHECGEDDGIAVSFDELWHAVRGGGNGYGVVTSVEYQLLHYPGELELAFAALPNNWSDLATAACGECEEANALLQRTWTNFIIDAHWNPSAIGMSEEDSVLCGGPGGMTFPMIFGSRPPLVYCVGNGGQAYMDAWKRIVSEANQEMLDAKLTQEMIDAAAGYIILAEKSFRDNYALTLYSPSGPGVPEGKIPDGPRPTTIMPTIADGLLVPVSFLVEERDISVPWLVDYGLDGGGMYMMGGRAARYHDGTAATSSAYREGAFWAFFAGPNNFELRRTLLKYLHGDGTPGKNFPPISEYNHMQNDYMGPLKTNWSEPCPRLSNDFTIELREESCIPILESIFGTEGLARLENVKSLVDPDHLFNSLGMVGYREKKGTVAPSPTAAPTPKDATGGTSPTAAPPTPEDAEDSTSPTAAPTPFDATDSPTPASSAPATHVLWIQTCFVGMFALNLFFPF